MLPSDVPVIFLASVENPLPWSLDRVHPDQLHPASWDHIWAARGPTDCVVMARPPPQEFLDYVESILGYTPFIAYPSVLHTTDEALCSDAILRSTLGKFCEKCPTSPVLIPTVSTYASASLAAYLDVEYLGTMASEERTNYLLRCVTGLSVLRDYFAASPDLQRKFPEEAIFSGDDAFAHASVYITDLLRRHQCVVIRQEVPVEPNDFIIIRSEEELSAFLRKEWRQDTDSSKRWCRSTLVVYPCPVPQHENICIVGFVGPESEKPLGFFVERKGIWYNEKPAFPFHPHRRILQKLLTIWMSELGRRGYRGFVEITGIIWMDTDIPGDSFLSIYQSRGAMTIRAVVLMLKQMLRGKYEALNSEVGQVAHSSDLIVDQDRAFAELTALSEQCIRKGTPALQPDSVQHILLTPPGGNGSMMHMALSPKAPQAGRALYAFAASVK